MTDLRNRLKNAELVSLLGAVVAGAGIALLLQRWLEPFKLALLAVGLVVHAIAMFYRQRLEKASGSAQTPWESLLYWSCWLTLTLLGIYIAVRAAAPPTA